MDKRIPTSKQSPSDEPNLPSSIPKHLHQPRSTSTSSHLHPVHIPQPFIFYVPQNAREILGFSQNSRTPESKAKRALLSNDPNQNAVAVVGMGGAGKTTILRALGRHAQVWAKFHGGVWFIELGHDATLQKLLDQMGEIVAEALPDFLPNFNRLAAKPNMHLNMMNKLIDRLASKCFLLIFDDVWDLDSSEYQMVDSVCSAVQKMDGTHCKVLSSTRNEEIGRVTTHDLSITVSPEDSRRDKCVEILCCYADIDQDSIQTFARPNRHALDNIIDMCAGLPLALSVAGSAMQDVLGRGASACGQNGIAQYWESLKASSRQLSVAESGSRHGGLNAAVQTSLSSLEKKWTVGGMTVGEMFQSFCIVQKQMGFGLCAIEKLWGVSDTLGAVRMFSRHSLVSLVQDEGGSVIGVRLHDLVHDLCVEKAERSEGVRFWHRRLVEAYQRSRLARESRGVNAAHDTREEEWWKLDSHDEYMQENVVRHLLGAGQVTEALRLLTDYRWIEQTNDDNGRPPFQKIIAELQLLKMYLERHEKTETGKRLTQDIEIVVRTMSVSQVLYCMKNRDECTFQLFGRLRDVRSESGIVERIVYTIERYARRPWVSAEPGVLASGRSLLRRVLDLEGGGTCMSVGTGGDEVIVGAEEGKVRVLDEQEGSKKTPLVGHSKDERVEDVFIDRSSGLIYSCGSEGKVIIWKALKKWRSLQTEGLLDGEWIYCMQVLSTLRKIVLGTDKGRLLVIDIISGRTLRRVDAHEEGITSLAAGGRDKVVVNRSEDGVVRVWDTTSFENTRNLLQGHSDWVRSVVSSGYGKILASGSDDRTVQIWDAQRREQAWGSSDEHRTSVICVLLSDDGRWLYSADDDGAICVWRVSNGGHDVSLVHTLKHASMYDVKSLSIGHESELFVLNGNRVHVWDARDTKSGTEHVDRFLGVADAFAVSADGAALLTWNELMKRVEIRDVCDVSKPYDRVDCSFTISPQFGPNPQIFALSSDRKVVAFAHSSCVVHLVGGRRGFLLHSLSNLDHWASGPTPSEQGLRSRSGYLRRGGLRGEIESLSFSPDGTVVSAVVVVRATWNNSPLMKKSYSSNVSSGCMSGNPLDVTHSSSETNTTANRSAVARLTCKQLSTSLGLLYSKNVTCEHESKSFTIATLEKAVKCAHYCSNTSRLWLSLRPRSLHYVDLIADNNQFALRNEPPLPCLSQPCPTASQDRSTHTTEQPEAEEVYDVFISHAGTDKLSIAEPLYELLVALGLKVFLDRAELRPGRNASQKMINAMRTAKIA